MGKSQLSHQNHKKTKPRYRQTIPTNSMDPHSITFPIKQPGSPPKLKKSLGVPEGDGPRPLGPNLAQASKKGNKKPKKQRGTGNHTPITFWLMKKATPAVSASAIQNACHTPTAPKMRLRIKAAGRIMIKYRHSETTREAVPHSKSFPAHHMP